MTRAGYERELELAATIQADLFPAATAGARRLRSGRAQPPGAALRWRLLRRDRRRRTGRGRALLCVADVSGKGLPASLLMSHMQATLRALLGRSRSLHGAGAGRQRVAVRIDRRQQVRDGGVAGTRAGHRPRPLRQRRSHQQLADRSPRRCRARSRRRARRSGCCLPACPTPRPTCRSRRATAWCCVPTASPTRRTSTRRNSARLRLAEAISAVRHRSTAQIVAHIFDAVDAFAASAPQFDDITLLVVRRDG